MGELSSLDLVPEFPLQAEAVASRVQLHTEHPLFPLKLGIW